MPAMQATEMDLTKAYTVHVTTHELKVKMLGKCFSDRTLVNLIEEHIKSFHSHCLA